VISGARLEALLRPSTIEGRAAKEGLGRQATELAIEESNNIRFLSITWRAAPCFDPGTHLLHQAWLPEAGSEFEHARLWLLDAESGQELWRFRWSRVPATPSQSLWGEAAELNGAAKPSVIWRLCVEGRRGFVSLFPGPSSLGDAINYDLTPVQYPGLFNSGTGNRRSLARP